MAPPLLAGRQKVGVERLDPVVALTLGVASVPDGQPSKLDVQRALVRLDYRVGKNPIDPCFLVPPPVLGHVQPEHAPQRGSDLALLVALQPGVALLDSLQVLP
jgi:hypothetical protein